MASLNSFAVFVMSASFSLVQRGLAFRARFPTGMHPNPLLRMLADDFFDHLCKSLCVYKNVALGVSGAHQLHRRLEAQAVLRDAVVPDCIAGNYSSISVQCHARNSRSSARGPAEEIDEGTLFRHGVLVGEDSNSAGLFQDFQQHARRLILEDWLVARQRSVVVHEGIDAGVIEG